MNLSEMLCSVICKYETDDKWYNQPGCTIKTNLVITMRQLAVITKFVVIVVTTKLVVSEYRNLARLTYLHHTKIPRKD